MRLGIAAKLGLLLAVVGILSAIVTGFYALRESRRLLVDSAKQELLTATQVIARRLLSSRDEVSRNLHVLASQPETLAMLTLPDSETGARVATLFRSLMAAQPSYFQVRLIAAEDNGMERVRVDRDEHGLLVVAEEDLQEKGHYPYVYETLALPPGADYLSRFVINRDTGVHSGFGRPTALLGTPVHDGQGRVRGLVVVNVDLDGIFTLLRADLPPEFQLFFTNDEGDYLIHPDEAMSFGFDRGRRHFVYEEFPDTRVLVERAGEAAGAESHVLTESARGRYAADPVVAAFIASKITVASGENQVILGLAQPRDSLVARADSLGVVIVQLVAGLSLLGILLAWILGRLVTRSLLALSVTVQAFDGRRLTETLPTDRADEIGELARSVDRMQRQIARQVDELEDRGKALQRMAYYDLLTGLPNRRLLMDRLEQALASVGRSPRHRALIMLDLDHFKELNDCLGHDAGDQLLTEVAQRLRSQLRQEDTVARLGGDEFVLVLDQLGTADDPVGARVQAEVVTDKLRRSLSEPYAIEVREEGAAPRVHIHRCTASIGVVMFGVRPDSAGALLKRADVAMYRAKAAGRDGGSCLDAGEGTVSMPDQPRPATRNAS
ncbi:MAG: diguanylate cyclase [Rhodocyclaceae bacterium]|nr:diguanylate cyclase [Rhodocyclaceae bacterium]